jgi:membrane associated rhomboid family serine protease
MTLQKRTPPQSSPILDTNQEETANAWVLVLSAVQIPHQIFHKDHTWQLFVPAGRELRAIHELECYFAENRDWPPKRPPPNHDFTPLIQPPTLLLIGALILFYSVTGAWSKESVWFAQGAGNADDILRKGEWWRLLTALTLHADTVHLLSNCLIGGWLVHSFCLLTGTGLGLSSLLLTAGCGNLLNVLLHQSEYQFVGFSTAVFAVIGMLAILSHRGRRKFTGSHILLPIMAGAALLAALGSSGEHTDLGAHFFGLLCGLLSGYLLSQEPLQRLRHSFFFQSLCLSLFISLLIGSWELALRP